MLSCRYLKPGFAVTEVFKKRFDLARTRTWNPLIRSQMPYPLGHKAVSSSEFYIGWRGANTSNLKFIMTLIFNSFFITRPTNRRHNCNLYVGIWGLCFNWRKTIRKHFDLARTRTWNPLIRSQMPYPLGHKAVSNVLRLHNDPMLNYKLFINRFSKKYAWQRVVFSCYIRFFMVVVPALTFSLRSATKKLLGLARTRTGIPSVDS